MAAAQAARPVAVPVTDRRGRRAVRPVRERVLSEILTADTRSLSHTYKKKRPFGRFFLFVFYSFN